MKPLSENPASFSVASTTGVAESVSPSHLLPSLEGEENECCVCLDAPRQQVFLPCGHVCVCVKCGDPLQQCPLCRAEISQNINLFR